MHSDHGRYASYIKNAKNFQKGDYMTIHFDPKKCIQCLSCMTIDECRLLIDMIRNGGPRFGEEKCDTNKCSKCIDICSSHALYIR